MHHIARLRSSQHPAPRTIEMDLHEPRTADVGQHERRQCRSTFQDDPCRPRGHTLRCSFDSAMEACLLMPEVAACSFHTEELPSHANPTNLPGSRASTGERRTPAELGIESHLCVRLSSTHVSSGSRLDCVSSIADSIQTQLPAPINSIELLILHQLDRLPATSPRPPLRRMPCPPAVHHRIRNPSHA